MKLYIVPTPIGNLEDITLRALKVLQSVDFIYCEDTRTTKNLLAHYQIEKRCFACHIHNEHQQLATMLSHIRQADSVALASDAGTPAISDPGFLLIRECVAQGIEVECLPGATAFVPALVASGLPCHSFYFHGFLPHKKGKESALRNLSERTETVVFYESPHRLLKTLEMMLPLFGADRPLCISREISKIHEEHFRGCLQEAQRFFSEKTAVKGEFVVVVQGAGR
ncbi:MAG: 16S rRNA (cytidine(1402)-2'-O)-methyltransferase [Bacteroidales bacterium]|jgi:16S rRNA (cytidine1402-2'-O)-methyltransferase|nr:16S rRNA (cytidine(1402)-2'-O)-methyltransferase [Bacteroidales bacterium]